MRYETERKKAVGQKIDEKLVQVQRQLRKSKLAVQQFTQEQQLKHINKGNMMLNNKLIDIYRGRFSDVKQIREHGNQTYFKRKANFSVNMNAKRNQDIAKIDQQNNRVLERLGQVKSLVDMTNGNPIIRKELEQMISDPLTADPALENMIL